MGGKIHKATIGNLREILRGGKPVVVDFWAGWCHPCHVMAPILRGLAKEYDDRIVFAKVDVENNKDLANQFNIKSIPTMVFFKKGKEWDRLSGVKGRAELNKILEKLSE
ncbi:MAG: thioredoxin [Candidatus Bathyarchaeia archaeon]